MAGLVEAAPGLLRTLKGVDVPIPESICLPLYFLFCMAKAELEFDILG